MNNFLVIAVGLVVMVGALAWCIVNCMNLEKLLKERKMAKIKKENETIGNQPKE